MILISQMDIATAASFPLRGGLTPEATRGLLFSKSTFESGDWAFDEGVWSFNLGERSLEFVQKDPRSELVWKCDSQFCELTVTSAMDHSVYLPEWIIPVHPDELRLVLDRKKKDKHYRLVLEDGKARGVISHSYKECPLCFFELHLFPVAILRFQTKRSCPHYLHSVCANALKTRLESRNNLIGCPVCFKVFTEVKTLPDLLSDPRMWFQLCDADLTGSLDKDEVLEGLISVIPVERSRLEKAINENWSTWDPDGDGVIGMAEFVHPKTGLKSFLMSNYNILKKEEHIDHSQIPPLDSQPKEWFDYWDYNKNGTLERIELMRALVKTFCVTAWGDPVVRRSLDISELALNLWDTLGYKPRDKLSFEEFMRPYGLADQVIHNNVHGQFFGENE